MRSSVRKPGPRTCTPTRIAVTRSASTAAPASTRVRVRRGTNRDGMVPTVDSAATYLPTVGRVVHSGGMAESVGNVKVGTASWTDKTLLASGWYPDDATT